MCHCAALVSFIDIVVESTDDDNFAPNKCVRAWNLRWRNDQDIAWAILMNELTTAIARIDLCAAHLIFFWTNEMLIIMCSIVVRVLRLKCRLRLKW